MLSENKIAYSRFPWGILGISFLFWIIRFGYYWASGDQDEVMPFLLHLIDESVLANDWFVQTQTERFGIRTIFVMFLKPMATIIGIKNTILVVFVTSWMAIAHGLWRLTETLGGNKLAAGGATFFTLVIAHKWTLGSNDLVYTMLVPEMVAWALVLPAFRFAINQKWTISAVLIGLSTWFQLLAGIHAAVLVGFWLILMMIRPQFQVGFKQVLIFSGIFLISAFPAVLPMVLQLFDPETVADPTKMDLFYIIGPFRNPYHHMFFAFGARSYIRFGIIVAAGGIALYLYLKSSKENAALSFQRDFIQMILLGIGILLVVALLFTEFIPILTISKLQLFKMTVIAKFLLIIPIGIWVSDLLGKRLPAKMVTVFDKLMLSPAVFWLAMVILAVGSVFQISRLDINQYESAYLESDIGKMEHWIQENTSIDAQFVIPPANSSFRSNARRPVFVNYAAFPYQDRNMQAWFDRITEIAPIELPEYAIGLKPVIDQAYHQHNQADWEKIVSDHGFDYILLDASLQSKFTTYPIEHVEGKWILLKTDN